MRKQPQRPCARRIPGAWILALTALLGLAAPDGARAERIAYFNGPGQIGFDNTALGLPSQFLIDSQSSLLGLQVKQKVKRVKQSGDGFDVTLKLKIKNGSDDMRDDLLVLLSSLGTRNALAPGSSVELELQGKKQSVPLEIVMLDDPDLTRFFAALDIGDLAPGKKVKTQIRYRIVGDLGSGGASILGLTAGSNPTVVPEPKSAALLAAGLLLLAWLGRRTR